MSLRPGLLAALVASVSLFPLLAPAAAAWRQLNGPEPPAASAVCEIDGVLVFGTNESDEGDLYRSTDDGANWTNVGLPNGGVQFLGRYESELYLGLYLEPVHRSTDAGLTWQSLEMQFVGAGPPASIASNGATVYLGFESAGAGSVHRSTDGGQTWAPMAGAPAFSNLSLAAAGSTLLFGSPSNGLFRSANGGGAWSPVVAGFPMNAQVRGVQRQGAVWFASASVFNAPATTGIYRSLDDGSSWSKVSIDLPAQSFSELHHLTAAANGDLYVTVVGGAGIAGLYRSTDGGAHWSLISASLAPDTQFISLLVREDEIFAGSAFGLHRTTDVGASWHARDHGAAAIRGVESLTGTTSGLFVGLHTNGGQGRGIWRTDDIGESWSLSQNGLPLNAGARALLEVDGAIYATVEPTPRGVYRTTDGGVSWIRLSNGISNSTLLFALMESDGVLFAGAYEALYRSTNGAASWTTVAGVDHIQCLAQFGDDLFAGTNGDGVFRSTDLGLTWSAASGGLDTFFERIANTFTIADGQLFVGTQGEGVYRWTGSGWVHVGLANHFVNELRTHDAVMIAVSALDGLFTSTDLGQTWTPFSDGFAGREVYSLAIHDGMIYAGTRGHSVWARPTNELPSTTAAPSNDVGANRSTGILWARCEPNPANDRTTLRFALGREQEIRIQLFDAQGRELSAHASRRLAAGVHDVALDLRTLPAGVMFYLVRTETDASAGRIVRLSD